MIGRPVAAAHLVLGLLAARLGPLDSHTPHLGEPGCAEEGRPVMGVSAAMFKWGAGPRDHTRNVQGLVMLYNIKTTYTLHGACACNPETVLKTRRGGDARALQGSLESKRLCQAEPQSNMHCQPAHTQPSITRCGTGMKRDADDGGGPVGSAVTLCTCCTNGNTFNTETPSATAPARCGCSRGVSNNLSLRASPTTAWFAKGNFFRRYLSFHQETLADCYPHCSPFLSHF